MKNNEKGLTLIEVLATVTILAVAILSVTLLLQQSDLISNSNERMDRAVQITRSTMEDITYNLADEDEILIYGQPLDLSSIRNDASELSETPYGTAFFPSVNDRQFQLNIYAMQVMEDQNEYVVKEETYHLSDYFVIIRVECINLLNNKIFELESLVEYN